MKVCDHLNLLEKDYYGLAIWETPTLKVINCHFFICLFYFILLNLFILQGLYIARYMNFIYSHWAGKQHQELQFIYIYINYCFSFDHPPKRITDKANLFLLFNSNGAVVVQAIQ